MPESKYHPPLPLSDSWANERDTNDRNEGDWGIIERIVNCAVNCVEFVFSLPGYILEFIAEEMVPLPGVRDVLCYIGRGLAGYGFKWDPVYSRPHSHHFTYKGKGRAFTNMKVCLQNGIMNEEQDIDTTAGCVSQALGGCSVEVMFTPSKGFFTDLIEAFILLLGFDTHSSNKCLEGIQAQLAELGPDGLLLMVLHSRGSLTFYQAQKHLTPEQREQIAVLTFGGAKMIDREPFDSAQNYVNNHDLVPLLADPIGYCKGRFNNDSNIHFLKSYSVPLFDHPFEEYKIPLEIEGRRFIRQHGAPQ